MSSYPWLYTRSLRAFQVIAALLLLFGSVAWQSTVQAAGTTYYVSTSGNDNNPGTSSSSSGAWKTIAKVNSRTFNAGDKILFQGGKTFNGTLTFDNESGTASNPIMIGSYGTGRATINGGNNSAIYVHNVGGYHISNINVVGSGSTTNTLHGIYFLNDLPGDVLLEYVRIDNVNASGFGYVGIVIQGDNEASAYKDVRITNVKTYDNADGGIYVIAAATRANKDVYIGYSEAYNNKGIPGLTRNSGNGIVLGRVDGGMIERSVAYNNGGLDTASEGPVGIWAWDSNNIIIQYNESYNNRTSGSHDGGGFDLDFDTSNSIMQYNYSHGNDGAGYLLSDGTDDALFTNNIVRYNISENDGRKNYRYGGLHVFGAVHNTQLYNNTIFMGPGTDVDPAAVSLYDWKGSNVHFRNNIFVTTSGTRLIHNDVPSGAGLLFQGNNYWPSGGSFRINWNGKAYTGLNAWRNATGQEKNGATNTGFNVNPQLTDPGNGGNLGNADLLPNLSAYRLSSSSPMINAGLNLSSLFDINPGAHDFYNHLIPQGSSYDIGAHEFGNMVINPSFEARATGWLSWWDTSVNSAEAQYIEQKSGRTGNFRLLHWSTAAYKQSSYQNFSNLAAGTYTLSVWIQSSGGQNYLSFGAKNCGGGNVDYALPLTSNYTWTQYSTTFTVTEGATGCHIYLWSDAPAGGSNNARWVLADDFAVVKQ